MTNANNRRILVLGSAPHPGADAFRWDDVPLGLSVADYDTVLLNLSLTSDGVIADTSGGRVPSMSQFARFLFSKGSEVVAIGNPSGYLRIHNGTAINATWWLPVSFDANQETGVGIHDIDPEWAYYFRNVRRWAFYVANWPSFRTDVNAEAQQIYPRIEGWTFRMKPLARTRFEQPLGFLLQCLGRPIGASKSSPDYAAPIHWLPEPTEITVEEAINLILRVRYHVGATTAAPAWTAAYMLPHQIQASSDVVQRSVDLETAKAFLDEAERTYVRESRLQGLIYERGEPLEILVRDALRELGAEVTERPKDREDGRLVDPAGRHGILEVKGRTDSAKIQDVRQLFQWVSDAEMFEGWEGKGFLVVNAFCENPPEERGDAFPHNTAAVAAARNLCLLTTEQIFVALSERQAGRFDAGVFWDTVFSEAGVSTLPSLASLGAALPHRPSPTVEDRGQRISR
jgi:hypothetical protein